MADFIQRQGAAAFGTRLRRLSGRIDREVQALYRRHGIDFEPRWFPVFLVLDELGPLSVGDLAVRIGVSHAAISQVRGRLVAYGLVRVSSHAVDRRRQVLALTARGRTKARRMRPLWEAIAAATGVLCAEGAPRLLDQLDGLEAALDRQALGLRVRAVLDRKPVRTPRRKGG
jgi:DNA-binding MarR family transcriptional regulator